MTSRLVHAIAGVALLATSSAPAFAAECLDKREATAIAMRSLQTDLMVAALSCDARADYNAFVTGFRPVLVENGKRLRGFFRATYGGNGSSKLNAFVTQLANNASSRSLQAGADFCGKADAMFDEVMALKAADLEAYSRARPVAKTVQARACRDVGVTVADANEGG